jgi:predicted Zn-dependent protease
VYEHIDWTGVSESEKTRWLERFVKTYDAATCVLLAESASAYLDRLEHSVAGLRIAPENAALGLLKSKTEHTLLAEGLKSIHAGNAGPARSIARRMLAADPDSAVGWMLRAQVERAGGNLALAKAAAQRAVDIAPEDLGTHFNLWAVLISAQDPHGAVAALRAGVLAAEE